MKGEYVTSSLFIGSFRHARMVTVHSEEKLLNISFHCIEQGKASNTEWLLLGWYANWFPYLYVISYWKDLPWVYWSSRSQQRFKTRISDSKLHVHSSSSQWSNILFCMCYVFITLQWFSYILSHLLPRLINCNSLSTVTCPLLFWHP